jgi:hypothetical protein
LDKTLSVALLALVVALALDILYLRARKVRMVNRPVRLLLATYQILKILVTEIQQIPTELLNRAIQ